MQFYYYRFTLNVLLFDCLQTHFIFSLVEYYSLSFPIRKIGSCIENDKLFDALIGQQLSHRIYFLKENFLYLFSLLNPRINDYLFTIFWIQVFDSIRWEKVFFEMKLKFFPCRICLLPLGFSFPKILNLPVKK